MDTQQAELQKLLQQLINGSEAIQSLPAEEKRAQVQRMMSATPEKMQQLVEVFENEKAELQQIDEEFLSHEEEINGLISEVKAIKTKEDRVKRIELEKTTIIEDQQKAEMLLKKLDDIL